MPAEISRLSNKRQGRKMIFSIKEKYIHSGILILRIGFGIMFILHGWPKFTGGPEKWAGLGAYGMGAIGINFLPVFWGFLAAAAEFLGGIHLIFGLFTRFAALFMMLTMLVAAFTHITGGEGISGASHALESAFVFAALLLSGGGQYSLDNQFFRKKI